MTSSLSRRLADAAVRAATCVPFEVDRAARLHLLDSLAVGALGAAHGPVRRLKGMRAGGGPASVIGGRDGAGAPEAALLNGAFIHSLEYDDTHVASVMHGSAVLTPAALAAAEAAGVGGARLVAAYAVGWEVLIRMGLAGPGTLQARGFQTTSAAGPFVAALVSVLVNGDPEHAVDALGIAGSQPGGTFAFLAGGDTVKAVQPGWAAHSGLWAADLARHGVTGPAGVLDGDYGFYRLYANDPQAPARLAQHLDDLGTRWHLLDAAFKLVPCCHFIHPYVEAVRDLAARGLRAGDVASWHVRVPAGAAPVIAEPWAERQRPATGHDVRWSLPYVMAAQLADGRVALDLFEAPIGGQRADLAGRMTYEIWDDSGFPARFPAWVEVTTTDGDVLRAEVDDVLGGGGRPVPPDRVLAKARECLSAAGLPSSGIDLLVTMVLDEADFDPAAVGGLLRRIRS
ncbi:MmgE/PrpD family protein [Kineosporia succinea]|uniref:2-methylcitrate dehydratase PrpD n=1 Tax=Kineosporia succinea TaxID=84632 RepID=A0ABT9PD16_9ACTN|nr:MmgE/PrpD family protein [Kineosporia succinea]MDP9830601.1 2-methylcitrate dehydratase PrpD [Kineosporia succinea]